MNSYQPKLSSPPHSEWGLINSLKQKQYEEALKIQKIIQHQKKQAFRNELENQLRIKQNGDSRQKSEDKAYYDFIVNKTKEEQNRSQQQKYQKYLTRKEIDQNNRRKQNQERQAMTNSRFKTNQSTGQEKYLIGFRDQNQIKAAQQRKKQNMQQEMQNQLRERQIAKKKERINEIQQFQRSLQQQNHRSRQLQNSNSKFKQNQKVYQHYNSLYQQKQAQINQLEYSFVDKPLMHKIQSQDLINKRKSYDQLMRKQQIKDALDQQVDQHKFKQMIERNPRPQQVSYSFFGQMFDQSAKGYGQYDKKSYNQYLQRQMAEQRENKKKFQFMDQREYLYNINQINKALNGNYLKDTYQDNSIANVGQKLKISSKQFEGMLPRNHSRTLENPQSAEEGQKKEQNEDKKLIRNNLQQILKKNTQAVKQPVTRKQSPYLTRKSAH